MREEVTKIVARLIGIPVQRLVEGEREKRLRMQDILHRGVVAQDEAVGLVADEVIRARSGGKDPQKPIGSFVFGARPLKRFLQHELETRIARALSAVPGSWSNWRKANWSCTVSSLKRLRSPPIK